jgi:hypothetical protein
MLNSSPICQCLPLWRASEYSHDSSGILLDRTAKNAKGAKKGEFPTKTGRSTYRFDTRFNQTSISRLIPCLGVLGALSAVHFYRQVSAYMAWFRISIIL